MDNKCPDCGQTMIHQLIFGYPQGVANILCHSCSEPATDDDPIVMIFDWAEIHDIEAEYKESRYVVTPAYWVEPDDGEGYWTTWQPEGCEEREIEGVPDTFPLLAEAQAYARSIRAREGQHEAQ